MESVDEKAWYSWLERETPLIEDRLRNSIPSRRRKPANIHEAIHYAVFPGGKRIRPGLAILGFKAAGGRGKAGAQLGAAIELLHTFSLIHDDLPCMDDDDLRRGRPTLHKQFDEATAVLAGDALQVLAFEQIAQLPGPADRKVRVLAMITEAVGTAGVIGGQVVDIESEGKKVQRKTLEWIHGHKTGALFRASLVGGAVLGGAGRTLIRRMTDFGEAFGLLFQIVDDVLNEVGSFETLGRDRGGDRAKGKATYPSVLGLEKTRRALNQAYARCDETVPVQGKQEEVFRGLVEAVVVRLPEDWRPSINGRRNGRPG